MAKAKETPVKITKSKPDKEVKPSTKVPGFNPNAKKDKPKK